MTHLHETSLMSRFLVVEFNIPFYRVQFVLQIGETSGQYYFSIRSNGILKTVERSNLKAHINEKMAVKEKEPYFNII